MTKLSISGVTLALLIAVLTPAPTGAFYTNDKLAFLTFSGPVQVPGATLQAGTYRFRLTNPETSRNVLANSFTVGTSFGGAFEAASSSAMTRRM